ncbi:MAG TPA: TolC family protein [Terriglobales bacterium]|nr:TolC family protein [Terriglobales bacterium]
MKTLVFLVLMVSTACAAQEIPDAPKALTDWLSKPLAALSHPYAINAEGPAPSPRRPDQGDAASRAGAAQATNSAAQPTLSITQAEQLALRNNPRISAARLTALASRQITRETRSAFWPTAVADFTGVDSNDRRIAAGALNNPVIYERVAAGASVTQLITDFGRTSNLVSSAKLNEKAENQNAIATQEQIRLAVDQAFYNALQAQSVTRVAEQTVASRQDVADQIQALFKSKLKSQLDLSFANVNLAQAKLLLLDAQNNESASYASLSELLGFSNLQTSQLVEDTAPLSPPPGNIDDLIAEAFSKRPELLALNYQYEAARKFQTAERDLMFPTVRAAGSIGDVPIGNAALTPDSGAFSNWYGAVGANIEVPIFNGFLYSAKAREAKLRTEAAREHLRDLQDRISRDVRTSWLNANTTYSRLAVSQQLLDQSNLALDLAQTRYKLGLGSIVELSQAQLQETQAEIGNAQAGYDYRLALAVLRYQTTGL